ncbi:DUF3307 domain-containing protein [Acetobacterium sp.]|uniref:DUF3307 domain-containing protein n=1 Tax=Acetobacterium sp. TaxID=1872094 RepID=UPI002F42A64A
MMIDNNLFWLLICGHFIGDFYFQTLKMAMDKKEEKRPLYLHALIYALTVFLTISPVLNLKLFIVVFLPVVISHFLIDFIKTRVNIEINKENFIFRNIFIVDQILHSAMIVIFASIYVNSNAIDLNQFGKMLLLFYNNLGMSIDPSVFLRFIFVFLIIGKPANILIKEINNKENIWPNNTNSEEKAPEYKNAGKLIGILERILIVILVLLNQYAAVGLIFAAKSLTRYNKIIKEPSFAEYYLVGTLLSLLIAIGAVLIIQPV